MIDPDQQDGGPVLGQLDQVGLREVWTSEPQDFTPWLADNLTAISDALGLGRLTLLGTEYAVGPFSIDVLAETIDGEKVVIENQLERSDHSHLGQILTYAAGVGASTVVWVLAELQNEHRAALDWLNEHTDPDINFFGVAVEVVKIGDSLPAVAFRVEARPNDWQNRVRSGSSGSSRVWKGWERGYEALAAVPAGAWTSLHDLAEVVGTTPSWIGRHMYNCIDLPNFHRMLNPDGTVWHWYRRSEREEPAPEVAQAILVAEGLAFDNNGAADPSQHLDARALDDLTRQ
jgi:alkylated DNA nucleotide flippase Atl1